MAEVTGEVALLAEVIVEVVLDVASKRPAKFYVATWELSRNSHVTLKSILYVSLSLHFWMLLQRFNTSSFLWSSSSASKQN